MDVNDLGGYFGSFAVTEVEAATPTRALGDRGGLFYLRGYSLYVTHFSYMSRGQM